MDNNRLLSLLHKHAQSDCTADELSELNKWYESLPAGSVSLQETDDPALARQMLQQFRERTAHTTPVRRLSIARTKYWLAAASVVLMVLAGSFFFFNSRPSAPQTKETAFIQPAVPAAFVRQVVLPDGSRVVLKPNSTLQFPPQFMGSTRTVTLTGEAYFDVVHNPAKPFIIQTQHITTTVLGTAFNISAWPGQPTVAVTVTRGKVRVDRGQQTLALLTANQQLVYTVATTAVQQTDKAPLVNDWLKSGMSFTDQSMSTIIPLLQQRFQKTISFQNSALQNCTVTASFDGTESLEQVLDILCLTINARYQPQDNGYVLTGEGCR